MSAFQANDESSILSARTKDRLFEMPELSGVFCLLLMLSYISAFI